MTDQSSASLLALPEGGAEVRLVVHLRWEDVAALGEEAGRLAVQLQRPVTLDEAAGRLLSARPGPPSPKERMASAPAALPVRSPVEQARQAIEQAGAAAPDPAASGAAAQAASSTARHASSAATAIGAPSGSPSGASAGLPAGSAGGSSTIGSSTTGSSAIGARWSGAAADSGTRATEALRRAE
ncbi:hypothetical protein [Streptacidiphilus sp. ASG 303]|uniref:hypothetical protein n=1 Tax=Streptacidiphilus sp. ASG 303 TaxID=2896847 RepID=UPI0027DEE05A|nr:hypothetical protein [Streptacidiphilus sp. ASG 303]